MNGPAPDILPKCPICGNDADKTNSHLIPWFIIKNCITEDGSGIQDKEISYTISTGHFTKRYTGRSILPEKLEELGALDSLQTEEENPYSRDYLICKACEAKLSRLESIFANQFREMKILAAIPGLPQKNGLSILIDEKYEYGLYQLFIQSIFYRCSIGRLDGFMLHPVIEKKIERTLQESFALPGFNKLTAKDHLTLSDSFPLITAVLHTPKGGDPTTNFVMINKVRFPYFIMAGKWLFQLWEKEKQMKGTQESLHGLRRHLDPASFYPIISGKSHLIILDNDSSEFVLKERLGFFVQKKIVGIQRDIRNFHLHMFGFKADPAITQYIQARYFHHLDNKETELEAFKLAFMDLKTI